MPERERMPIRSTDDGSQSPKQRPRIWLFWLAVAALLVLPELFSPTFGQHEVPYSTFLQKLDSGSCTRFRWETHT